MAWTDVQSYMREQRIDGALVGSGRAAIAGAHALEPCPVSRESHHA